MNVRNICNIYDSRNDTNDHKTKVNDYIHLFIQDLIDRGNNHDNSKLEKIEKDVFDEYSPKLKGSIFGSDEYKQNLKEMKVALDHHYKVNRHHPEHFDNKEYYCDNASHSEKVMYYKGDGKCTICNNDIKCRYTLRDMTLVDIIEMLADMKAASDRHDDGDIMRSIEIQKERFGISDELCNILINTIKYYF